MGTLKGMDVDPERFTATRDFEADLTRPHPTTGHGHAVNFDGNHDRPQKTARRERTEDARVLSPVDIFGDGATAVVTRESGSRTFAAFSRVILPGTAVYNGDPVLVVGPESTRARVIIANTHASDLILIGGMEDINAGAGYPLVGLQKLEPEVQGAIYAVIPAGQTNPIRLGIWAEYN